MEKIKSFLKTIEPVTWALIVCGLLGFGASLMLIVEEIHKLENPEQSLVCDLNPVISCGDTMTSEQARVLFDIPNPILGVIAFSSLITIGMAIVGGAKFKRWFWLALNGGVAFGMLFSHWFIYQALYEVGKLCMFCMLVWLTTISLFVITTFHNIDKKRIVVPTKLKKVVGVLRNYQASLIFSWYVIIFLMILERFWDYWSTLV